MKKVLNNNAEWLQFISDLEDLACYLRSENVKMDKNADKDNVENKCEYFKNKADFVEVVRCRECKHCEILQDEWDNDWYFCKETVNNAEVKADDYCSYGAKKDVTDINVGDKKE